MTRRPSIAQVWRLTPRRDVCSGTFTKLYIHSIEYVFCEPWLWNKSSLQNCDFLFGKLGWYSSKRNRPIDLLLKSTTLFGQKRGSEMAAGITWSMSTTYSSTKVFAQTDHCVVRFLPYNSCAHFFSEVIWILADFLTNLLIKKSFSQIKFFETNEMTFLHLIPSQEA